MALSDPADKGQDQFKPVVNRRAGYSADGFQRIMACARKGGSLAAGEGLQIIEHFEELLYRHTMAQDCGGTPCGVPQEFCSCCSDVRKLSPA